ncbi:uncharacterized protein FIBRA_07758 [Fibroporia radiculosa]|uniref:Structural maintenance of chromosomes protein 5 n=1 Tax=Fibroporia radiculosa TaxID=599839 RepID=J4I1A7_9APHY|nr:uncharacterized protein FIBRA_07758 [Fibroporia radiculosa]CCM05532.1 predicted protein [Fibroporia radiculosa]
MARRVLSHNTDDSQKENSAPNRDRGKTEQPNQRRMAKGKETARRRVDSEEEHDALDAEEYDQGEVDAEDGEEEAEGDDDEEDASPKGRKRARANTVGDSRPAVSPKPEKKERIQTLPRDTDGFIPGSIVRIKLESFVTYDSVEFRPGPYLNMIFGPNGTGKSTIACAICLGLNFPPNVLGRASDLNSFVKIGADSGFIEIELKGPKGKSNLVIRRTLTAKTKSSTFTLNGQSATGREIQTRMAQLNVQISNLCTFLPQDKVSEFAQMSPQQLLRETQRAAGNANLTSWHDTLISSGKDLKQLLELLNTARDQHKTLQDRNATLEREVKKYEERRQIERDIELLELFLPFREYIEAKEVYTAAKEAQKKLLDRVKQLQARNAPIEERKNALEKEMKEYEERRNLKKASTRKKFDSISRKWGEAEKMGESSEDLKTKLENLKTAERNRLKEIARLEKAINSAQNDIDNPPPMENLEGAHRELKHVSLQRAALKNRIQDLQDRQKMNVSKASDARNLVDRNGDQLRQLDDANHRKLEGLARWDGDCANAVRWLRANRHRFKMEVFEPPILCLTVPDKRFVNAVEACFGTSQLKTFVAQCEEDYRLFNHVFADTPEALGKKVRLHTWFRPVDENLVGAPPLTEQEMREYHFDGYAIDYVSCPEGLKWFLRNNMQLHRVAIALDPRIVDPARTMEIMSSGDGSTNYVVGNVFNSASRSRYGKRLAQTSTREIRQAKNLVSVAVDEEIKRRVERALAEARDTVLACENEATQLAEEEAGIRQEDKVFKDQIDGLQSRISKVLEQQKRLTNLKLKMERDVSKLDDLRLKPSVDVERARLKRELLNLARKRADHAKDYLTLIRAAINEQEEATCLGLQTTQIAANKVALEALHKEKHEEYQKALARWTEAKKRYEAAKQDSKEKLEISKQKLDSVDDDIRERFRLMEQSGEASEKTADEVQTELAAKKAQLELNNQTNAGVVDQYKRRQAEIEALSTTIADREKRIERIERQIKSARNNWQPALEALVQSIGQKFSAAFDRLGCAGEVRISENEDYDKWAIDILVKFRDHEKLQLLTGERQSGGERSLTTILYLMSLTEEARAPFSLVDEINQGMDQRAERAVHNSLVDVTCKADSGQYFLITPKLLPDLNYAERMKVLCVNNGEWLPEESPKMGNMMSLINGYLQHNRANASP